jgi:hypothetical protein
MFKAFVCTIFISSIAASSMKYSINKHFSPCDDEGEEVEQESKSKPFAMLSFSFSTDLEHGLEGFHFKGAAAFPCGDLGELQYEIGLYGKVVEIERKSKAVENQDEFLSQSAEK